MPKGEEFIFKNFGFYGRLSCVCGPTKGSHNIELKDNQTNELHCEKFGCRKLPIAGSTKATIKAKLLNSFTGKETKTKWVQPWLHQVEMYMETQCFETDKERIHFVQTLLKEHTWEWWMSQK
jgi:hypothetical protein